MKIFKLKAVSTSKGYTIEEIYFTSIKKATESYRYLVEYLITNHDIDKESVVYPTIYNKEIALEEAQVGEYHVILQSYITHKKVMSYI